MQVWSGHATGRTDQADQFATLHLLTLTDFDVAHMTVHRNEPLSMDEKHGVPIEEQITRQDDGAWSRSLDRCAALGSDIESAVRAAGLTVEYSAATEGTRRHAVDRLQKRRQC